ncbi:hypothetical protein SeLEV6574_g08171 [Synchytrium endobioticum]|uniref:Uncharacterized protein n=1 Tax=Synchytrium endobioticum TaxID=286115 RepID=A0A507C398_9FUNG|nr:hypothetical protein SeLEV6574_g08171 [Synchytrium endobioticum]
MGSINCIKIKFIACLAAVFIFSASVETSPAPESADIKRMITSMHQLARSVVSEKIEAILTAAIPKKSPYDGYVTMSEECLFDLLFDIPSFQKTVREVAGVGPKALKIATRVAFMKNPSKGRLLDEVFLLPPEMLAKSKYVLDDSPRRYVRTPSFKTNGLVLSLLWIDTTSKPPPPDRKVEDAINLPNIFHNKALRSTHKDARVIALDPGATCIAGAVAFDPNHPDQRRNLAVTTKSLAEPERRYRNWQEADKPEAIYSAERDCTKTDQETWAEFLERFVISYDIARC